MHNNTKVEVDVTAEVTTVKIITERGEVIVIECTSEGHEVNVGGEIVHEA